METAIQRQMSAYTGSNRTGAVTEPETKTSKQIQRERKSYNETLWWRLHRVCVTWL